MYFDSLTIAGIIVFVIAVAMFVGCCLVHQCAAPCEHGEDCGEEPDARHWP